MSCAPDQSIGGEETVAETVQRNLRNQNSTVRARGRDWPEIYIAPGARRVRGYSAAVWRGDGLRGLASD